MSALDDAVGEMVDDLLAEAGAVVSYLRGGIEIGTLTMSLQRQPSQYIDNQQGGLIEITPVDFIAKTSDLPSFPPLRGDQIVIGGETFEVVPTTGEKVFRRVSYQMTRIHTKQAITR